MTDWRAQLAEMTRQCIGQVWYVWGAQSIGEGVADCSGLVVSLLRGMGRIGQADDYSSRGLWRLCQKKSGDPQPGDLAFYGWPIHHVAIVIGRHSAIPGVTCVASMSGGGKHVKSKKQAQAIGAGLWVRRMKYRKDFRGVRCLPDTMS